MLFYSIKLLFNSSLDKKGVRSSNGGETIDPSGSFFALNFGEKT